MNWWEWALSCGLVFVGHARTLWLTHVPLVRDEPAAPKPYDGPLVDRTDPEDISAWQAAVAEDCKDRRYRTIVLPSTPLMVTRTPYLDTIYNMLTTHWCEKCGLTSSNPNDVKHSYCGSCHHFCKEAPDCDPTLLYRHRDDWPRS